ncbi:MAG: dephospho-CoA kinase [Chromatiaceae bacterium]|jgi:dephospho-CoA kinase
MLVVALTGGIGSGKSTVSDRLAALGVPVIDADVLAREVTAPGSPALAEIETAFGPDVFQRDGSLDRAALRRAAFAHRDARERLEAILHPRIRQLMKSRIAEISAPYAVLVIPLLFEAGQTDLADRILVVDAPEATQVRRVQQRSGLAVPEIERIMASQITRSERLERADDVIDNSSDLQSLLTQTDQLHAKYLRLSRHASGQ